MAKSVEVTLHRVAQTLVNGLRQEAKMRVEEGLGISGSYCHNPVGQSYTESEIAHAVHRDMTADYYFSGLLGKWLSKTNMHMYSTIIDVTTFVRAMIQAWLDANGYQYNYSFLLGVEGLLRGYCIDEKEVSSG